jgi:Flp pilus assembly protein TadG
MVMSPRGKLAPIHAIPRADPAKREGSEIRKAGMKAKRTMGWKLGADRGGTLVEFAVSIPIVVLMMMGIFEFGRLYYTKVTVQHAVREAARFAVTGNTMNDPDTGDPLTRAESIKAVIRAQAQDLDIDLDRIVLDPADGGGPGDVVRVSAGFTYQVVAPGIQSLFPGGLYDFTVSTAMVNEPFNPAGG